MDTWYASANERSNECWGRRPNVMRTKTRNLTPIASIAVLVLAPLALGAKGGCTHAVVGDDGPCQGEHCGEAGMDDGATGGTTGTGTGGGPAHGGGTATGGG